MKKFRDYLEDSYIGERFDFDKDFDRLSKKYKIVEPTDPKKPRN